MLEKVWNKFNISSAHAKAKTKQNIPFKMLGEACIASCEIQVPYDCNDYGIPIRPHAVWKHIEWVGLIESVNQCFAGK